MLGGQKRGTIPGWSIVVMACLLLLIAVSLFIRTMGAEMNADLFTFWQPAPENTQALTIPSTMEFSVYPLVSADQSVTQFSVYPLTPIEQSAKEFSIYPLVPNEQEVTEYSIYPLDAPDG